MSEAASATSAPSQAPETLASAPTTPSSLIGSETPALAAPVDGKPAEGSAKPETPVADKPAEVFAFDKLKLPDGFTVPDEAKVQFSELVNTHKVPAEAAQGLMDMYAAQVKSQADANTEAWNSMQKDWQAKVKADPEIGGAKFDGTIATIAKVVNDPKLTDPGFKEAMNLTGAGNNPAVIKTLAKWAAMLSEGSHVQGSPEGGGKAKPANLGEALYGPGKG